MTARRAPGAPARAARSAVLAALLTALLASCGTAAGGDGAGPVAPLQPDGLAGGPPASPEPRGATPPPEPPAPTPSSAALRGLWGAGDGDGAQIVYEFDADGTFTRVSLLTQERRGGTFRFQDVVEGTFRLDGDDLTLRPTAGSQTVDDPAADTDGPVSTATTDLARERHTVELRDGGAVLVLTPRDGAPVVLRRQGS